MPPKQRVREKEMAEAVARYLRSAAREVTVDGYRFDVVAYDKRERLFKLVECRRGSRSTSIGRAFGQLVAYYAVVSSRGFDFVNAVRKKMRLSVKGNGHCRNYILDGRKKDYKLAEAAPTVIRVLQSK